MLEYKDIQVSRCRIGDIAESKKVEAYLEYEDGSGWKLELSEREVSMYAVGSLRHEILLMLVDRAKDVLPPKYTGPGIRALCEEFHEIHRRKAVMSSAIKAEKEKEEAKRKALEKYNLVSYYVTLMLMCIPKIPEEVLSAFYIQRNNEKRQQTIEKLKDEAIKESNEHYKKYGDLKEKSVAYLKSFFGRG